MLADMDLLRAWRDGDTEAADALLRRHFDGLYRFFRFKVGDDAVEDLVQRSLLACVEGIERIGDAGFRSYLFGVARNQLMQHLRERYRRGERIDPLTQSLCDVRSTPSRQVARRDGHQALLAAMQTLPIDTQILLELAYWEELPGKAIAAALDIGENTVRSRLARARAALKQALEAAVGEREAAGLLTTVGKKAVSPGT